MKNQKIKMIPVESSNVKSVGYDEEYRNVHIELISGERYMYQSVPKKMFEDLLAAPSKGAYIHRHFKDSYENKPEKSFYALQKAAEPLVAYLRQYYCPHDQAIVSYDFVKITSDNVGVPFKL